jgi:hypothetical protein
VSNRVKTTDDARAIYFRAAAEITKLRGKIKSAEKQVRCGSETSAKIASSVLPALRKNLTKAERKLALMGALVDQAKTSHSTTFRFNYRTTPLSVSEALALTIPRFLRRAA